MIFRHEAKTVRTFLLDEHFGREVLATELTLLDQLWNLVKQLLCFVIILERDVTTCCDEVIGGMTPTRRLQDWDQGSLRGNETYQLLISVTRMNASAAS